MREFAKGQYIFVSIPTGMESCGCLLPVFHSLCGESSCKSHDGDDDEFQNHF